MLDGGAFESNVSELSRAATELHKPKEGAASHCGLYKEHVSVCDMAQNPVDQLAVVRDSVHAESSEEVLGDTRQIIKLERIRDEQRCTSRAWWRGSVLERVGE